MKMFMSRIDEAREDVANGIHYLRPKSNILRELSEFLFDIFDANCMEEYTILDEFERKAMSAFDGDFVEFTHEQHQMHGEFMRLFESLIERFLDKHKYTSSQLVEDLQKHYRNLKEAGRRGSNAQDAEEVIDVIAFYTCFEAWANMMKENARMRRHYKTFVEKLLSSVSEGTVQSETTLASVLRK